MKHFIKRARTLVMSGIFILATAFAGIVPAINTYADGESMGFSMSPLKENMILSPGDTYSSSFTIFNPATNAKDFPYEISISPFYVDENYTNIFTAEGNYSEITEWITIDSPLEGTLVPNQSAEIYFTVNVPVNAPAGGQYAAIVVTSAGATNEGENTSAVIERTAIAHTIFAEITGETVISGEVTDVNVPSFMLSGEISGEATIKNTGNVHGEATYTLQVFSFSGEEIYSNAETPDTHDVLPNRTYYHKTSWKDTPGMGIFNVKYTVDFEGSTTLVEKLVIICPIWLLFIVIAIIIAIIVAVYLKLKKRS